MMIARPTIKRVSRYFPSFRTNELLPGSRFLVSSFEFKSDTHLDLDAQSKQFGFTRKLSLKTRNLELETRNCPYAATVAPGYSLPSLAASPSASVFTSS